MKAGQGLSDVGERARFSLVWSMPERDVCEGVLEIWWSGAVR